MNHGIKEWLDHIRSWSDDYRMEGRLTWIKVYGVPIDCWSERNFTKIASLWGIIVKLENCNFEKASSLAAGRILVNEFPLEKET